MKNCSGYQACSFRTLEGTSSGCTYEGYCDFQLPRDSRSFKYNENSMWDLTKKCQCIGKTQITAGICPYCGLSIS